MSICTYELDFEYTFFQSLQTTKSTKQQIDYLESEKIVNLYDGVLHHRKQTEQEKIETLLN